MFYLTSDAVDDIHPSIEPIIEVYIKEEPIDIAVVSTSSEHRLLDEKGESIDVKREPSASEDEKNILYLVSLYK